MKTYIICIYLKIAKIIIRMIIKWNHIDVSVFGEFTLYTTFYREKKCRKSYGPETSYKDSYIHIYIYKRYSGRSLKEGYATGDGVYNIYIYIKHTLYVHLPTPQRDAKNEREEKNNNSKYKNNRTRAGYGISKRLSGCRARCWQMQPESDGLLGFAPGNALGYAKTLQHTRARVMDLWPSE